MGFVVRSDLLRAAGFRHGFSTRTGGVSEPPFDSLNLARTVGDDPAAVAENRRRLAAEVGYEPDAFFSVSQVHGAQVVVLSARDEPEAVSAREADAIVARVAGQAASVRVADCVPVLIADPETGAVAAAHAGWRGTVAGVVAAAVDALDAPADRLLFAIGPHIRLDAFEVGEEVAERIAAAAPGVDVVRAGDPRPHADLAATLRAQMHALGTPDDRIDDVGGCTVSEPARFFSYRRDGKRSGRQVGVIVAR